MRISTLLSKNLLQRNGQDQTLDGRRTNARLVFRFVKMLSSRIRFSDEKDLDRARLNLLIICHGLAFLYSTANSIKHAAFPYLIKELKVTKQQYGYLLSAFAFGQLLGAPVYGHFSDMVGVRIALCVSFAGSAAVVLAYAAARGLLSLLSSCLPSIALHGMQVIYMVVADNTNVSQRADMLGKLSLSYGSGTILGSLFGGTLTEKLGPRLTSVSAAVGFSACFAVAFFAVPSGPGSFQTKTGIVEDIQPRSKEPNTRLDGLQATSKTRRRATLSSFIAEIIKVLKYDGMVFIVVLRLLTTCPILVFHAMTPLVLVDSFRLRPKTNGKVSAFLGVVAMIVQGALVGALNKRMTDARIILLSASSLAVGFLFLTVTREVIFFCAVASILVFGISLCHVIITSLATRISPPEDNGTAVALATSTPHALVGTFAPTLGGLIYSRFGFPAFGLLGYIMQTGITLYLIMYGRKNFKSPGG